MQQLQSSECYKIQYRIFYFGRKFDWWKFRDRNYIRERTRWLHLFFSTGSTAKNRYRRFQKGFSVVGSRVAQRETPTRWKRIDHPLKLCKRRLVAAAGSARNNSARSTIRSNTHRFGQFANKERVALQLSNRMLVGIRCQNRNKIVAIGKRFCWLAYIEKIRSCTWENEIELSMSNAKYQRSDNLVLFIGWMNDFGKNISCRTLFW